MGSNPPIISIDVRRRLELALRSKSRSVNPRVVKKNSNQAISLAKCDSGKDGIEVKAENNAVKVLGYRKLFCGDF